MLKLACLKETDLNEALLSAYPDDEMEFRDTKRQLLAANDLDKFWNYADWYGLMDDAKMTKAMRDSVGSGRE